MTASKWDLPKHPLPALSPNGKTQQNFLIGSLNLFFIRSQRERSWTEQDSLLDKATNWIPAQGKWERGLNQNMWANIRPQKRGGGCGESGPNEVSSLQGLRDSNDFLNKGSWVTLPATACAACVSSPVKWAHEACFWKWGESWGFILHDFCSVNQICPSLQLCAHSQRGTEQV